jgi:hypothetical protein
MTPLLRRILIGVTYASIFSAILLEMDFRLRLWLIAGFCAVLATGQMLEDRFTTSRLLRVTAIIALIFGLAALTKP